MASPSNTVASSEPEVPNHGPEPSNTSVGTRVEKFFDVNEYLNWATRSPPRRLGEDKEAAAAAFKEAIEDPSVPKDHHGPDGSVRVAVRTQKTKKKIIKKD